MITVRVDEHGPLVDVDIEGQAKQTGLVETQASPPTASVNR